MEHANRCISGEYSGCELGQKSLGKQAGRVIVGEGGSGVGIRWRERRRRDMSGLVCWLSGESAEGGRYAGSPLPDSCP